MTRPCSCETLLGAASRGRGACVRRFQQNSPLSEPELTEALSSACLVGDLDCITFLAGCGAQFDQFSVFWLIYRRRLPCVQFLHSHGVPWTQHVMSDAAMSGDVQMMKYIYERIPLPEQTHAFSNPETTFYASTNLECLQYTLSHGCQWHHAAMIRAAEGHLDCLQYCYDHGAQWDTLTSSSAACRASERPDYCACLVFLVERGCPIAPSDRFIQKNRGVIALAMARRRAAKVIQLAWRSQKRAAACKAVSIIEDAYIKWTCRPGAGQWYQRSLRSFCCNASS